MINFKKNIQHYIQTGDTLIVNYYIPYMIKNKEILLKRKFKGICVAKKNRAENSTISLEAKLKNLVFGELNRYESYLLERKHLNHHFEQFGLI